MEMIILLLILLVVFAFAIFGSSNDADTYTPSKPTTPHYTQEIVTGHVYVIYNDLFREYKKIGMTTREVEDRVREFNTAVPINFEIAVSIPCTDPYSIEQDFHLKFDKYRVSRNKEWFKISDEELLEELNKIEYINAKRT